VGVLFITATVAVILSGPFIGSLDTPDYLVDVAANQDQVLMGMFLQLIWAFAVVGIPVVLFPILKKYDETLALGFFSARIIEGVFSIIFIICELSLLTLSQEYVAAGGRDVAYYQASGILLRAVRDWAFEMGPGIVFTLSALILNYTLYRSKLVPRWLSGWGLIGALLMLASHLSKFFSINLPEILFVPIALQEMVFAVWLIAKGFNSKEDKK
jgi:hypothetical protein